MVKSSGNRPGFALLAVLVLMAVGTALIVGAIDSSLAEGEIARSATMQRRALVSAETGLWSTVSSLGADAMRIRPLGPVGVTSQTLGDMTLIVTVDKVDTSVVWTVATATIRRSGMVARHRLGMTSLIPGDPTDPSLHPVPERAWVELF